MESSEVMVKEEVKSDSGTDEDLLSQNISKKKYTQKVRKCWFSDPRLSEWIRETKNNEIECKFCNCVIKSKLSSLLNHAKTSKHMTAASSTKTNALEFLPISNFSNKNESDLSEELCDEVNSSSEKVEDIFLPGTTKKKYTQKIRECWFNDPRLSEWIIETTDNQIECKYCNCVIKPKLSYLLKHGETKKHVAAASPYKNSDDVALDFHTISDHLKIEETEISEEMCVLKNSNDKDLLDPTSNRKHIQKFRNSWLTDPRLSKWLIKVNDNESKCKYCNCGLKSKLCSLLNHARSSKHKHNSHIMNKSNMSSKDQLESDDSETEESELSEKLWDEIASSDKDEDLLSSSKGKRKYIQKVRKSWFSDPRLSKWIMESNNQEIVCKYCGSVIKSKLSSLLNHAKTSKHVTAAYFWEQNRKPPTKMSQCPMVSLNPDLTKPTCRVCLQNCSDEMNSIYDVDTDFNNLYIYEQIEQCADIKVSRHEKLPSLICNDCYGFLKVSYKFRTICRNSSEYLKEFVDLGPEGSKTDIPPKENPLSISENPLEKADKRTPYKALRKKPQIINAISRSNSPADELISDRRDNEDGDGIWFDDNYQNDSNFEIYIEQLDVDVKEEQLGVENLKKPLKRKKKFTDEKPRAPPSKTLEISSDGAAIIREKKTRAKKEKQPHICDICGNMFQRRYALELHVRRHRDVKPYECEICGYAFHSSFELIRHMRKHTGSKPYKCSYCSRAFGDQSTLIKHERIHRNERPFKCETCGKTFTYSNVLKYHKLTHTGEKPYTCELCGKCFTRPHHLRAHLETMQHQNDPRSKILLQNIRKNNEDEKI